MPLDILMGAARDKALPIELRLAAARAAAPYYHARVSGGPPKAAPPATWITSASRGS